MQRSLFASPGDSALRGIIDRDFDRHLVSEQDLDIVHAQLSGDMGGYDHIVRKLYLNGCIGEHLDDGALKFNYIILRQNNLLLSDIREADAAYTFVSRMGPSGVRATVCS